MKDINNPKDIKFLKYITKDSDCLWDLDNTFTIFKSINNILFLIYSNVDYSIIAFNLIDNKKIIEIKYAHEEDITNFRHYLDLIYKRDLLMSISGMNGYIKIWNVNNFELLLNIENIYSSGFISSSCFINDFKENFIITSSSYKYYPGAIKVFDFNGNKVKEIKDSKDLTFFIDTYYDKRYYKIYIITGNIGYIKAYDFINNEVKNIYCDNGCGCHYSIIIYDKDLIKK